MDDFAEDEFLKCDCFFLYQNWLDPSKEIKKQIRGKCSRQAHTRTHTFQQFTTIRI